jgi:hypothetical protein
VNELLQRRNAELNEDAFGSGSEKTADWTASIEAKPH